jgi:MOSC domain-containing protein YiiM
MSEVVSTSARKGHGVGKTVLPEIQLIAGQGVEGDAHCGERVKHRSRARYNPSLPNLRQVHLIHTELLDELAGKGFDIAPGELGENILTRGFDLLALPTGTVLSFPSGAVVEITGLRNPCIQLERHKTGLMNGLLDRHAEGNLVRKAGVMGIVREGGIVRAGDAILVGVPEGSHRPLIPV